MVSEHKIQSDATIFFLQHETVKWRQKHGGRRDDRVMDSIFAFAFLADWFSNVSWLIQDDKNKKLFQDCAAKIKTQIAWLKTSKCHPWLHNPSTSMSLWEMSSFYFSIFELLNKRWFNFQKMSITSMEVNILLNVVTLFN